jgi:mevalonate kinase
MVLPVAARAPAKVILTGEHFVVLGAPALAMAVDLYSTAYAKRNDNGKVEVEATVPLRLVGSPGSRVVKSEKLLGPLRAAAEVALDRVHGTSGGVSVQVECNIPIGAGLGSSASTSVAIIAAVAESQGVQLGKREIFRLAYTPETLIHNKPSGVDQATTTYGGVIQYRSPGKVETIKIDRGPCILVCDTGLHRSTGRLVGAVVKRSKSREAIYRGHVDEVTRITKSARRALEGGRDEELGELMNRNQELLQKIGVSHPMLERLIKASMESGALGAKLTGAGGGGCMIALCRGNESKQRIACRLRRMGGTVYKTSLARTGVEVLRDS